MSLMSEPHETILNQGWLSPMERQALTRLIMDLSRLPEVQSILLFGSRARGCSTDSSDLDVAVVLDDANRSTARAVEQAKWRALPLEAFMHVNLITLSQKQLESQCRFSFTLYREGIPLWTRNKETRSRKSSA
jgi:predicted nucleotidyltransferase